MVSFDGNFKTECKLFIQHLFFVSDIVMKSKRSKNWNKPGYFKSVYREIILCFLVDISFVFLCSCKNYFLNNCWPNICVFFPVGNLDKNVKSSEYFPSVNLHKYFCDLYPWDGLSERILRQIGKAYFKSIQFLSKYCIMSFGGICRVCT